MKNLLVAFALVPLLASSFSFPVPLRAQQVDPPQNLEEEPAAEAGAIPGGLNGAQSGSGGSIPTDRTKFVPLTSIPGVNSVAGAANLPAFLNSLYMISVGAAAVLAVLQIVRSGITYMLNDTGVTEKRDAKKHILMSLMGLVLVLSPALVFGIINPDILNLRVDLSGLAPGNGNGSTQGGNENVGDDGSNGNDGEPAVGGDPATGCDPGYEPVGSPQGETCEPVIGDDGSDDGVTGGSVPLRICIPGTEDRSDERYVYVGSRATRYSYVTQGEPVWNACTEVVADIESATEAACRMNISSSRTSVVECALYEAGSAVTANVAGPLCPGSERYALNSSNLECN